MYGNISHCLQCYNIQWAVAGLGLAACIYPLDDSTTYTYLVFVTSSFERHTLIMTIQVLQSITCLFTNLCIYLYTTGFYVVSYINRVETVVGRAILHAVSLYLPLSPPSLIPLPISHAFTPSNYPRNLVLILICSNSGYTGLQLFTQIIIADTRTPNWRGPPRAPSPSCLSSTAWDDRRLRFAHTDSMSTILVPAMLSALIIIDHTHVPRLY
ncbi:hypothetical protein D9619_005118 [Psilocybe cf. subviscida]|uniref:Uncharacterized protein n=1 Tax=Psilocybe cf. subviscida TaxID=2480587 RepID=A0A8H5BPX4_9AGAR|nr:hypothetical protein D9619_005118 [Psilocybe cf. subviscida]